MDESLAYTIPPPVLPIGKTKFYEEVKSGRIPVVKVGRRTLVTRRALEEYVEMLERESGGAAQ